MDSSAAEGRSNFARLGEEEQWSGPFKRDVWLAGDRAGARVVISDGDQDLWYFVGGAVLLLTLASVPLLRERERRLHERG